MHLLFQPRRGTDLVLSILEISLLGIRIDGVGTGFGAMNGGGGSALVQPPPRQELHRLAYLPSIYYSDQMWPIFIFNPKPSNGLVPLKELQYFRHWHFIFLVDL